MSGWLEDYLLTDLKEKMKHKATEVLGKRTRKTLKGKSKVEFHKTLSDDSEEEILETDDPLLSKVLQRIDPINEKISKTSKDVRGMPTSSRSPPTKKSPFVTRESSAFATLREVRGGVNKYEWSDDSEEDKTNALKLEIPPFNGRNVEKYAEQLGRYLVLTCKAKAKDRVKANHIVQGIKDPELQERVSKLLKTATSFEDVLKKLQDLYPTLETDLLILGEISKVSRLPYDPKPEQVVQLFETLERLFGKLNLGVMTAERKFMALSSKINDKLFVEWTKDENPETDELSLVSLSEKSCQKVGGKVLSPAQSSLRISLREAYSLLPSLRKQVLIDLGDLTPTVDLYANRKNHTEPLYCTPLNSCYAYNWYDFNLCWANPPWSHLEKKVTKAVLDRAQVVVICPDWSQTGEAVAWRPLLNRIMKVGVRISDVPLYLPDGATSPLPAPRTGSSASLIDGNDCDVSLDELNPQVVKFLHRVNLGLTRSDLLKRYGHNTPATTPKDESEVPEIHPPTESDEEQDAGVRDAEVDKDNIQWEEFSEEPAEVQWDEVSEDGFLADLNIAQPLKYDPFPSIHEDCSDRIEDLLNEVDLKDSVMGGVQNFTMSCLAVHAMQEYGVTMQVEEDKASIANQRGWPVSKDDLRSLKEVIELRIFQISEKQQRLELKDRWKSQYSEFTGRSVDGDETDLYYQYLDEDRFIVDGNDVCLDVSTLLTECYSVSRDEYGKSNLAAGDDFEEKIKNLPSKIQKVQRRRKVAFGPLMAHGSCEKLVTMDLELMDKHKHTAVRSKPFPASKAVREEIMWQITECIAADLAEKYEQAEYPKHCSPCFLVDKPGSNAKRLVVHYGKLNKLTKKH